MLSQFETEKVLFKYKRIYLLAKKSASYKLREILVVVFLGRRERGIKKGEMIEGITRWKLNPHHKIKI